MPNNDWNNASPRYYVDFDSNGRGRRAGDWELRREAPETPEQAAEHERAIAAYQAQRAEQARQARIARFHTQRNTLRRMCNLLDEARATPNINAATRALRNAWDMLYRDFPNVSWQRHRAGSNVMRSTPERVMRFWTIRSGLDPAGVRQCSLCGEPYHDVFMSRDNASYTRHVCPHCVGRRHNINWEARTFSMQPIANYDEDLGGADEYSLTQVNDHTASPIRLLGRHYRGNEAERVGARTRLFGFEIEFICQSGNQLDEVIRNPQRVGIFKYDGSLPSTGAEFCTLPMTRAFASNQIDGKPCEFADALLGMQSRGARAWNRTSCGLHIHVTRASATWITWGKVERFMNAESNQRFIDKIAGRLANSYCDRESIRDAKRIPISRARSKANRGADRYQALNFSTGGKPTVEFRLFRGNVAYKGVIRAMEFCDSLIEWARTESSGSEMDHACYLAWLKAHAQGWPTLSKFLRIYDKRGAAYQDDETLAA